MSDASKELSLRLLKNRQKQVLLDHPEAWQRIEVWPLDQKMAILEVTSREPRTGAKPSQLDFAHRLHAEAYVRVMEMVDGLAELVRIDKFEETNPRSTAEVIELLGA